MSIIIALMRERKDIYHICVNINYDCMKCHFCLFFFLNHGLFPAVQIILLACTVLWLMYYLFFTIDYKAQIITAIMRWYRPLNCMLYTSYYLKKKTFLDPSLYGCLFWWAISVIMFCPRCRAATMSCSTPPCWLSRCLNWITTCKWMSSLVS